MICLRLMKYHDMTYDLFMCDIMKHVHQQIIVRSKYEMMKIKYDDK